MLFRPFGGVNLRNPQLFGTQDVRETLQAGHTVALSSRGRHAVPGVGSPLRLYLHFI